MDNAREAWCARMQARILRNIEVHPETGCWLWTGRLNNSHYGVMSCRVPGCKNPRPLFAHRVAWEAFRRRRMPRGRVGAHSLRCKARRCCNPAHIRATSESHNARDRERAKRREARKQRDWGRKHHLEHPPTHTIFRVRPKTRAVIDGIAVPF